MNTPLKLSLIYAFVSIISMCLPALSQKPDLVIQAGHRNMIRALALDSSEKLLASGGADNTIIVWDLDLKKQVLSLKGHTGWISALAFSPDKKFLASGSYNGEIKLWNLATAKLEYDISLSQPYDINSFAFSHDGKTLAIASANKDIDLWDLEASRMRAPLIGHTDSVTQVVFHPVTDYLFSSSLDKTIRSWELQTNETDTLGEPLSVGITDLAFSPEGKAYAFSTTSGGSIGVLDYSSGEQTPHVTVIQPQEYEPSRTYLDYRRWRMAYKTNLYNHGTLVFLSNKEVAFADCFNLTVWDLVSNKKKFSKKIEDGMGTYAVVHSKKRNLLIYNDSLDINLLDITTKKTEVLKGASIMYNSVAFTADGRSLAATYRGGAGFWDDARRHKIFTREDQLVLAVGLRNRYVAPFISQNLLATIDADKSPDIKVINLKTGKLRFVLKGHANNVEAIAASEDGNLLVSSAKKEILFWNLNTRKIVKRMQEKADLIQFSPNGQRLITIDRSGNTIKGWKLTDLKKEIFTIKADVTHGMTFSADSRFLAAQIEEYPTHPSSEKEEPAEEGEVFQCKKSIKAFAESQRKLNVWNAETGELVYPLDLKFLPGDFDSEAFMASKSHCEPFATAFFAKLLDFSTLSGPIIFNKDSSMVAASRVDDTTGNNQIKIWSLSDGKEVSTAAGHSDSIRSLAFSPNGKILASCSWDRSIKLWDTATGRELATFILFDEDNWVIYTPEGQFDTNLELNELDRLSWKWPEDPFNSLSAEVFMRDYYEPNLLGKILTGESLHSVGDISYLNRTQPAVNIKEVKPDGENTVQVIVEVSNVSSKTQIDADSKPLKSGVYDVTLYRDNQMVAGSPTEEALKDYAGRIKKIKFDAASFQKQREIWRLTHKVDVDADNKAVLTFRNVQLPRQNAKNVKFSAYAYNSDEVRSEPATFRYELKTPQKQLRKKTAYIITVGVDANQSGMTWNLDLAVKSATDVQRMIGDGLFTTHRLVNIQLNSSFEENGPRVALRNATKENIENVLAVLAGKTVNREQLKDIPNVEALSKALPDDLVFLYIASHGYADPAGNFYVIPFDTGSNHVVTEASLNKCLMDPDPMSECESEKNFIERAISTEDLTVWWRGVDAGQIVMILDSCHSGSIVPDNNFKPGPWGDRNFARLAYNKGLMLLAASQKVAMSVSRNNIKGTLLSNAMKSVLFRGAKQELSYLLEETKYAVPEQFKLLYPKITEDNVQSPIFFNFSKRKQ